MAFKIVNNEVVENGGNGVFDSVAVGINDGVTLTPIEVLVHDGLGTATLQNVTIDGATVIITGVGGLFTTDDITEGTSNLFYTDARAQAVSINSLFEDPSPMLSADLDAADLTIASVLKIGFNTIAANPIHAEGCLFYDNVNKALSYFNDATDVTVNIGREQLIRIVNNTASIIVNGSVCRISGSDGTVPEVSLSQADTIATSTVAGIATHDIGIGEYGYITVLGTVRGLSTSLYSAGDAIYLSDTLAGNWTTTPPTFPSYVVELGVVSKVDAADGEVEVRIHSHAFENLQVDGTADFEIGLNSHGNIDMLSNSIINVAAPANPNDAVNKNYVDALVSGGLGALTTDDIAEATNLYYTDARSRSAISVTGTGSYDSINGVIDIQGGVTSVNTQTGDVVLSSTEISEGTNLYYTDSRVDTRFDTRLALKSTTDLTEGSNLYYTTARFDSRLALKTTTDLAEGTNLYYTTARFDTRFDSRLALKSTDNIAEGANLYYTDTRFDTRLAAKSTTNLTEGSNLYYTTARANSAIDTRVNASFVNALNVTAAAVQPNSVTLGTGTTGNYVATITGTGGEIDVTGSGTETAAITLSLPTEMVVPQNLTVTGNLTVNGTTITNDTSTVAVNDPYITVGGSTPLSADDNKDRGVRFRWHDGAVDTTAGSFVTGHVYIITATGTTNFTLIGAADSNPGTVFTATGPGTGTGTANDEVNTHLGFFGFDDSDKSFFYIPDATETGETFAGTIGNAKFTTVTADLVGNVTGNTAGTHTGAVVGNASTATALQTARTFSLAGDVITASPVSFNGTGDIVLTTTIQPNSVALGTDTSGNYVSTITAGTGIVVSGSGVETAAVTVTHADTSTQASVNNSNGVVIQDITLDDFGHITAIGSLDLDTRYYTETEADARFVNTAGDTLTGFLTLNSDPTALLHAASKQYVDAQILSGVVTSAGKWTTARSISLGGDATGSVSIDGSSNVTLTVAVVDDSHTHDGRYYTETEADARFVNATGDTLTGFLTLNADPTALLHAATKQYVDAQVTSGVVTSANKWTTARSITLAGDATGSVSIDGSANVTLTVAVADDSHNHDGRYYTETESDARFANVSGDTFTGTVTAPTFIGALSGNATSATSAVNATFATSAGTASEWTTARSIILAGDATGSVSINGSANVTLTVAVVDNSHAHTIANVTGLQAALDSKLALTGGTMSGSLTIGTIVGNAVGSILNVTGNIVATGDVTAYSDRSLKDNIVTIDSALDKVSALRGVYFDKDGKASTGVIAQEVEEVLPEVVHTQENGLKSVAYGNMVGLLIEAVKELTEQNKQMAAEIARLNDRLNN